MCSLMCSFLEHMALSFHFTKKKEEGVLVHGNFSPLISRQPLNQFEHKVAHSWALIKIYSQACLKLQKHQGKTDAITLPKLSYLFFPPLLYQIRCQFWSQQAKYISSWHCIVKSTRWWWNHGQKERKPKLPQTQRKGHPIAPKPSKLTNSAILDGHESNKSKKGYISTNSSTEGHGRRAPSRRAAILTKSHKPVALLHLHDKTHRTEQLNWTSKQTYKHQSINQSSNNLTTIGQTNK